MSKIPSEKRQRPPMPPSQRHLFRLFFPLALSGAFFPVARPLINAALSRTPDPEHALALFSIALSVTIPLISPLYSLRQVTTALSADRDMLRRIRKLTLTLGTGITIVLMVAAIPWMYRLTVQHLMHIPAAIAANGPPVLFVLALTPLLSVGRGYYQGVLVHHDKAGPIGIGALGYLISIAIVLAIGVFWFGLEGALLAALSALIGQIVYLVIVWLPSRPIILNRMPERSPDIPDQHRNGRYLIMFYLPLAVATILTALIEPALQTGMARTALPALSLAAYPVATSLSWLARTPLWNAQQVVISQATDYASYCATRKFMYILSFLMMGFMALLGAPGISRFVFGNLMGLGGQIQTMSISGFRWLIPDIFFQGLRSLYYGALIRQNATGQIQKASIARAGALIVGLSLGVHYGHFPGLFTAIWASLFSEAVEVAWLYQAVDKLPWSGQI